MHQAATAATATPLDAIVTVSTAVLALVAVIISLFTYFAQRRRDANDLDRDARLTAIEEGRRADEVAAREHQAEAAKRADVRPGSLTVEVGPGAGKSNQLLLTIVNRGPAIARDLRAAIEAERTEAAFQGWKREVERVNDNVSFFLVDSADPLAAELAPEHVAQVLFWYVHWRTEFRVLLRWTDDTGSRETRTAVYKQDS